MIEVTSYNYGVLQHPLTLSLLKPNHEQQAPHRPRRHRLLGLILRHSGVTVSDNHSQGPSIYDVRKIVGVLDPPPPFVRISHNLSVLFVRKISQFYNPPLLSADVINGWPLVPPSSAPLRPFRAAHRTNVRLTTYSIGVPDIRATVGLGHTSIIP